MKKGSSSRGSGGSPSTFRKPGKIAAKPLVIGGAARRIQSGPLRAPVIDGAARRIKS